MKLHCPLSGIIWNAEGFASIKGDRHFIHPHPIFSLPLRSLLSRTPDFYIPEVMSSVERRLLFLALLKSSEMIEWRTVAAPSDSLISQMFEKLVSTIGWLDFYTYDSTTKRRRGPNFPRFVISSDTASLKNLTHWLDAWADAKGEYEAGQKREEIKELQKRREFALQRLIANTGRDPQTYAKMLASWAADASEFPTFPIAVNGETLTCREYWIRILCNTKIYEIRDADLQEIEEHLIENLDHGSSYAVAILNLVRRKKKAVGTALGLDDIFSEEEILDMAANPFQIVSVDNESVSQESVGENLNLTEEHNIKVGGLLAPEVEPIPADFKSHAEYLRAKARWILSQSPRRVM